MNPSSLKDYVPIGKLFQDVVNRCPNHIAVKYKNSQLTYLELNTKANQLASYLQSCEVKPGMFVALSVFQDLNSIVAILAILKVGGVYLPIDPAYPESRFTYILEDAKPHVLLTQSNLISKFKNIKCSIIAIDTEWNRYTTSFEDYSLIVNPNELAYIVYTSGSTGQPKGIMIEHKSFPHIAMARKDIYPKTPTALLSESISFDPSILTLFYVLIAGGTICIPENKGVPDPHYILELLEKYKIDFLLSVPSFYTMILQKNKPIPFLKHVSLCAETFPAYILQLHSRLVPQAFLYNEYGPSEYAIGATLEKVYDPILNETYPITIGKPLPNTEIYILDHDFKHIPIGQKGEIFIAGIGLARGYLHKEQMTQEKFVFVALDNELPIFLYRTGDFGCMLPDGNIEFLGRMDRQVKMPGGYRVELEEIEYAARQYPKIHEAVVIIVGEEEHRQLILFVSSSKEILQNDAIKSHLSSLLPKYMVPARIIQIEKFPLTSHGKIDRKALSESLKQIPHNILEQKSSCALEKSLLDIWKFVLKTDQIGINENFFDLGGNSIQLATVQTYLENMLHTHVSIVDLFTYPTISLLVKHINNEKFQQQPKKEKVELATKKAASFAEFKR